MAFGGSPDAALSGKNSKEEALKACARQHGALCPKPCLRNTCTRYGCPAPHVHIIRSSVLTMNAAEVPIAVEALVFCFRHCRSVFGNCCLDEHKEFWDCYKGERVRVVSDIC